MVEGWYREYHPLFHTMEVIIWNLLIFFLFFLLFFFGGFALEEVIAIINNGGFMKTKKIKNKIGFVIWTIIGFCLVMLLYKIGANAETIRNYVPVTSLPNMRINSSYIIGTHSGDCLSFYPVQSGITYYFDSYSGGRYGFFTSVSKDSACVDSISSPYTPNQDGFFVFTNDSVCVDVHVYYKTESEPTKTLTDISVNKTKTTYFVGEEFSINDISVDALYSDLSSENVINFTVDYSNVNINVAGTYSISITYEGITKTIPIVYESIPVTLTSISAVKGKTNYYVGDTLNTNDFVVTGIWSDGSETVLSDYTVNISSVHMNTVGSYPIMVSYEDKTTTVYITVNAVEEPPVEPPLGDLTTTNALLQKLNIDLNNNLYEVRLLCGFNVALLIASIFLRRKS